MKKALLLVAVTMSMTTLASAGSLYFQGFESDTSGWTPDTGGTSPGTITQVSNGGGTLGLTAPDGTHYAEVTNSPDSYQAGYGTGGYSLFGAASDPTPYPGAPFAQSLDVYIDTSLTMASGVQQGFWIDSSPSSTDPFDVANDGGDGYGAEHNFRLDYTGSDVLVTVDGQTSALLDITSSGWYDFQFLYAQSDAVATDTSNTTVSILTTAGSTLASETVANNSDGETLQNQYLAGPGYVWLPVWQDGFSGNTLGIDDVQAFTASATPEPASLFLMAAGLGGLLFAFHRRRGLSRL